MKIEIIREKIVRIEKIYTLKLSEEKEIFVTKWYVDNEMDIDADWEFFDEKSKETFNSLSEEEQDEVYDFINDIAL